MLAIHRLIIYVILMYTSQKDWYDQTEPVKPFPETYIFSDTKDI